MVFYTKAFHKSNRFGDQDDDSSVVLDVEDSESVESEQSSSSTSSSSSSSESHFGDDLEFGKKRSATSSSSSSSSSSSMKKQWMQWMCSAKLGVLAALATVIVAYLSVKWFKRDWFVKIDPVKKTRELHFNKIMGAALCVFVAVTLIAYVMNR